MAEEQAKQFIDQAMQSLQSGQFQQALELVEQSIALEPENTEAFVLKGIALSQTNQPDAATEAFRHAIMLFPYNVKAYYNLAVHYYSLGNKAAAEEMAREAVRTEPKHAGARDLIARIEAEKQVAAEPSKPLDGQDPFSSGLYAPAEGAPTSTPSWHEVAPPSETPSAPMQPPPGTQGTPPSQAAPPVQTAQPMRPMQPVQPMASPQTGYHRPGYEHKQAHSVSFIENLGRNWDAAGYGLGIAGTVVGLLHWGRILSQMAEHNWNVIELAQAQQGNPFGAYGDTLLTLIALFVLLLSFVWMIMELTDRRGNWLWLLPFILCCCCWFYGPIMMIYLWKGRD